MMLGAHSCLPVIGVTAFEVIRVIQNKPRLVTNWQLFFIGIGGMLPDLLWPHTSMAGRLSSPTHTIWFIILLAPITFLLAKKYFDKNVIAFTFFFVFAALLHIVTDGISGGVAPLYPIKAIWGMRLIPFRIWIAADIFLLLFTFLLIYLRNWLAAKKVVV
jgi:hypothetical protein